MSFKNFDHMTSYNDIDSKNDFEKYKIWKNWKLYFYRISKFQNFSIFSWKILPTASKNSESIYKQYIVGKHFLDSTIDINVSQIHNMYFNIAFRCAACHIPFSCDCLSQCVCVSNWYLLFEKSRNSHKKTSLAHTINYMFLNVFRNPNMWHLV